MLENLELAGLHLTIFGVCTAIVVIALWFRNTMRHVGEARKGTLSPAGWVTLGVFIIHAGDIFDNSYWFTTWMGDYLGAAYAAFSMKYGYIWNIPFRNIPLIASSFCFLMAYYDYSDSGRRPVKLIFAVSFLVAVIGTLIIYGMK